MLFVRSQTEGGWWAQGRTRHRRGRRIPAGLSALLGQPDQEGGRRSLAECRESPRRRRDRVRTRGVPLHLTIEDKGQRDCRAAGRAQRQRKPDAELAHGWHTTTHLPRKARRPEPARAAYGKC